MLLKARRRTVKTLEYYMCLPYRLEIVPDEAEGGYVASYPELRTKRQLVCFGGGALVGIPLFFLLKGPLGNSSAAICMIVVMMPFFLFALYEKNGLPLEKYLLYFVRACFIRPKQRPYMTNNFYAALEKQDELDREVHRIVHRKT